MIIVHNELERVFYRFFEVVRADTSDLLDEVYRLRYQVYCVEHPFEVASQFPDGREIDPYDKRAAHALVRHHDSGLVAATVRLILPDPADSEELFPIEAHCRESFSAAGMNPAAMERENLAEISRFAVSKEFRRRAGEKATLSGVGPDPEVYRIDLQGGRVLPHLTLGLFVAIVRMSADHGITQWYGVMEPSLLRLLSRFGIRFQRIGKPIDYHGKRQPCYARVDEVLAGIWSQRRDVWEMITDHGRIWPAPSPDYLEAAGSGST